jgi:predicted ATPase
VIWLAEAYGKVGQPAEGLRVLRESEMLARHTHFQTEHHHLKGTLLLQQPHPDRSQAETAFHKALSVACHQQAKSWELRAATSLARLWQSQDKRKDAYELLAPVYGWFTEGHDTADLKDAKALLDELEGSR